VVDELRELTPHGYVSLREYMDARFKDQDKAIEVAFTAQKEALAAARAADKDALAIKERADRDALQLARDQQTYKDEQANRLREQLGQERGTYATKSDLAALSSKLEAMIAPLNTNMSMQQGRSSGMDKGWAMLISVISVVAAVITVVIILTRGHT
jgi:hypothetical protein